MRLREVGRIAQVTGWYEPRLETEEIWLWELDIRPLAPLPHLRKPQPRLGYAKDGARQGGEDRSRGKHRAGFVECRQRSHSDTVFTLTSWRRRHGGGATKPSWLGLGGSSREQKKVTVLKGARVSAMTQSRLCKDTSALTQHVPRGFGVMAFMTRFWNSSVTLSYPPPILPASAKFYLCTFNTDVQNSHSFIQGMVTGHPFA